MSAVEIGSNGRAVVTCSSLVAATALLLATTVAHAECTSPGFDTTGRFCNNCRYEGTISVTRDQACQRPYRPSPNAPVVQFFGNRVVQRAKHGIAGANGTSFAYMPSKGYSGPDDFTVEVDYRQGNDTGKFTVHFSVTVQ